MKKLITQLCFQDYENEPMFLIQNNLNFQKNIIDV